MVDDPRRQIPPQPGQPEPEGPELGRPEPGRPRTGAPILDQAFDAGSLYALRAAVAAHASQAGLSPGRAEDLVVAVHELAANAVRHGAGHGRLRVWKSDQALRCEVSDDGTPPAAAAPDPAAGADPAAGGDHGTGGDPAVAWRIEPGHGLALVRLIADQASVSSGPDGTLATISFALPQPGRQAPHLRVARQYLDGCTVLALDGPLDLSAGGQLTDAVADLLAKDPDVPLVVDVSGMASWDSSGLTALIAAQQQVSAVPDARMVLAGLPDHLNRGLRDAGLADRFTLADSTAAAAAALNRKPR